MGGFEIQTGKDATPKMQKIGVSGQQKACAG
jgi:hypothetical protein